MSPKSGGTGACRRSVDPSRNSTSRTSSRAPPPCEAGVTSAARRRSPPPAHHAAEHVRTQRCGICVKYPGGPRRERRDASSRQPSSHLTVTYPVTCVADAGGPGSSPGGVRDPLVVICPARPVLSSSRSLSSSRLRRPSQKGLHGAPDRPGREWVFIARNPWLPANVRLPSVRLNVNPCQAAPELSGTGILCTLAHQTDS